MSWEEEVARHGWSDDLPMATSTPGIGGELKATPDDFFVDEELSYVPPGEGPHLLLRVRKQDMTTPMLAREIAAAFGVNREDVGYGGMKDRHATTTQWFSVLTDGMGEDIELDARAEVIERSRNTRKLKASHVNGNRFGIRVSGVQMAGEQLEQTLSACLSEIERRGVPNLFGPQRFGGGATNVGQGLAVLRGQKRVKGKLRRLLISAVQSAVFNLSAGRRWDAGTELVALPGDLLGMAASTKLRRVEDAVEDAQQWIATEDWIPTASLPGPRSTTTREVDKMERAAAAMVGVSPDGLSGDADDSELISMRSGGRLARGARRPIVVRPSGLRYQLEEGASSVYFDFWLPTGSYATVVVREFTDPRPSG